MNNYRFARLVGGILRGLALSGSSRADNIAYAIALPNCFR
jgi:hypothetical protein